MICSLRTGQTLKHYAVLHKIGQGGMKQVYKAEDKKLGRLRALEGDAETARTAYDRAAAYVREIAVGVDDDQLRANFLNSAPVRDVFAGAGAADEADGELMLSSRVA